MIMINSTSSVNNDETVLHMFGACSCLMATSIVGDLLVVGGEVVTGFMESGVSINGGISDEIGTSGVGDGRRTLNVVSAWI